MLQIYEQANPKIVHLFEVYLSLAACEMELKSLLTSVDGSENATTLESALEFYRKALGIAEANKNVIENDGEKMGYMYYSRAVCHTRRRDYQSAFADVQRSLRLRIASVGHSHRYTLNCYILLADIYSRYHERFSRHNRLALETLEKTLKVAQAMVWKGADVDSEVLEHLMNMFMIICFRLRKDYASYETTVEVSLVASKFFLWMK